MKTFTTEEVEEVFASKNTLGVDLYGQLIIYTGMFQWSDGTYRDEPENENAYKVCSAPLDDYELEGLTEEDVELYDEFSQYDNELMTRDRAVRKTLLAKLESCSIPRMTVIGGGGNLPKP